MIKALFLLLLIVLTFPFCTEYEEGPYFSLRSKEKKVCQKWEVESVTDLQYDETYTSMYRDWEMEISVTGTYTKKIIYLDQVSSENGTWEFDGSKHIRFYYTKNNSNFLKKYEIIRLSKNEMWLRDDLEEIHYRN
ncbi:MAG: hypothetical protein JXR58_07545 [Bacteroidales bacterium]|nr:hypothetical protein [Bacteroidales bacterium]